MNFQTISCDFDEGGILTITLDRPAKLNALTWESIREIIAAFDAADADDNVRVVVVTGRGDAFCAGTDLSGGSSTFRSLQNTAGKTGAGATAGVRPDPGGPLALRIFESLKPVIGAINGPAVGVGATMTLPMDVRLASSGARFGFVFNRRGIVPDACSSWFLPRIVGIGQAIEWVLTGRVFSAYEALEGGLVKQIVPADELLPTAYALAREMGENCAPVSLALSRQLLWRMLGASHPMEAHRVESWALAARSADPDSAEGVAAFLEKRGPQFSGRVSRGLPDWFVSWSQRPDYDGSTGVE